MRSVTLWALSLLLSGCVFSAEAPGVAVGAAAPAIEGKKWFTSSGTAPEYKGKVYLVEFWFAT